MVSLIVSQRLIRQSSLISLSNSRWRQVVFWLSVLLRLLSIFSAVCILVLYSIGVGLYATSIDSTSLLNNAGEGLTLMRAGVGWLLALGVLTVLLVFFVVVTARVVPRHQPKIGTKLGVFFLGTTLLVVGQGFHFGAIMDSQVAIGRVPFYVAGFLLEILVVVLYALTNIDVLFHEQRIDSFAFAKNTTRPISGPYGLFRQDGNNSSGGEPRKAATIPRGVMARKPLAIEVVEREGLASPFSPAANGRSLSLSSASEGSETSQQLSQTSEVEFSGLSRPRPLYQASSESEGRTRRARTRETEVRFDSSFRSRSPAESPQNSPSSPYDPLGRRDGRQGIAALERQLRNNELAMKLSDNRRSLY